MKNYITYSVAVFIGQIKAYKLREYPSPDLRGPMPQNAHPDSNFSSFLHNDWTYVNTDEYPSPDLRGPMP
jgi:hypothetical protein